MAERSDEAAVRPAQGGRGRSWPDPHDHDDPPRSDDDPGRRRPHRGMTALAALLVVGSLAAGDRGIYESEAEAAAASRRLSLGEALRLAAERGLDEAASDEQVAKATAAAARVYPFNPFVQFQALPYQSDSPAAIAHYVLAMETIELGRQQRWRRSAGRAAAARIRADRRQIALSDEAAVARLFFAAVYQRELADLLRRRLTLDDERLDGALERVASAPEAIDEVTSLRLGHRMLEHEIERLVLDEHETVAALAERLAIDPSLPLEPVGLLETWRWQPLAPQAAPLADHPIAAAAAADEARAAADAGLARANRIPNLLIGPYYQRGANGVVSAGFRGQVTLPTFDTGRRLVRQRAAEAARQRLAAARAREDLDRGAARTIERYNATVALTGKLRCDLGDYGVRAPSGSGTLSLRERRLAGERLLLESEYQIALAAADVVEATDVHVVALLQPAPGTIVAAAPCPR
ncbi:MAG: TolC family protein [Nannocystaceae bacterium]